MLLDHGPTDDVHLLHSRSLARVKGDFLLWNHFLVVRRALPHHFIGEFVALVLALSFVHGPFELIRVRIHTFRSWLTSTRN